jgi:hypothetical protein
MMMQCQNVRRYYLFKKKKMKILKIETNKYFTYMFKAKMKEITSIESYTMQVNKNINFRLPDPIAISR